MKLVTIKQNNKSSWNIDKNNQNVIISVICMVACKYPVSQKCQTFVLWFWIIQKKSTDLNNFGIQNCEEIR